MTSLNLQRSTWLAIVCSSIAPLLGCGKSETYELAPVSGMVTLDGNPVPYTQVTFLPQGTPQQSEPGPGSIATCDDAGRYELKTVRGDVGAVVGTHRIQISSTGPPQAAVNDGGVGPVPKEAFPARYNTNSELTFDVPADGTDAANFELTSK